MSIVTTWNKLTLVATATIAFSLGGGGAAQALNIVTNGGFENPDIPSGTYSIQNPIPGWTQTGGATNAGIEIQDNVAGSPYEGNQFVELDGNGVSQISQTLTTIAGQKYKLSFAISPRAGISDNRWDVIWNGGVVDNITRDGSRNNNTVWELLEYFVTATSNSTVLSFGNLTEASNSLGAYLDDVQVNAVPTPAAILPSLIGMGMAVIRKRKRGEEPEYN